MLMDKSLWFQWSYGETYEHYGNVKKEADLDNDIFNKIDEFLLELNQSAQYQVLENKTKFKPRLDYKINSQQRTAN